MNTNKLATTLLNSLAPIVALVWILGGLAFILGAFSVNESRFLYLSVGVFVLIAGVMMLVVKRANSVDIEKFQRLKK